MNGDALYDRIARIYDPWSVSVTEDVELYVEEALAAVMEVTRATNGYAESQAPWTLHRDGSGAWRQTQMADSNVQVSSFGIARLIYPKTSACSAKSAGRSRAGRPGGGR